MHNLTYLLSVVGEARAAILEDRFPEWLKRFFAKRFPESDVSRAKVDRYPKWAIDALRSVNVNLLEEE